MFYPILDYDEEQKLAENQTILYGFSYPLKGGWYGKSQHKVQPQKGMIVKDPNSVFRYYFATLKKDGTPKANGVSTNARYYSDNYQEAVQKYNELIEERKNELLEKIKNLDEEKQNLRAEIESLNKDML